MTNKKFWLGIVSIAAALVMGCSDDTSSSKKGDPCEEGAKQCTVNGGSLTCFDGKLIEKACKNGCYEGDCIEVDGSCTDGTVLCIPGGLLLTCEDGHFNPRQCELGCEDNQCVEDKDNPQTKKHDFDMSCTIDGCEVVIYTNDGECYPDYDCNAKIGVSLINNDAEPDNADLANVPVTVSMDGTGFTMGVAADGESLQNNAQIKSDSNGQAFLYVRATEPGFGVVNFSLPMEYGVKFLHYNVQVRVPEVLTNYEIQVNASYAGSRDLNRGTATKIANVTCGQLLNNKAEGEVTNLDALSISQMDESKGMTFVNNEGSTVFTDISDNSDKYAIFVTSSDYMIWGCQDGLDKDNAVANIVMHDAVEDGIIDPVIDPNVTYDGLYNLATSFNALSLLPHAEKAAGQNYVRFSDMLVGDWIEFALNLLSDPAETISNLLLYQVLPLLLDSNWIKEFLAKIGLNIDISNIEALVSAFQLDKALENVLQGFVDNLGDWYGETSGIVSIVNDFATHFTVSGSFLVNTEKLDTYSSLPNVSHRYDSILVNTGRFGEQICTSDFASIYGHTSDNQGTICKIGISRFVSNGVLQGVIPKIVVDEPNQVANIQQHVLNIPYGKIILGLLMDLLPKLVDMKDESGNDPQTVGEIVEFFVGKGAAGYWNKKEEKKHETDPSYVPELVPETGGCATIGTVITKSIGGIAASLGNGMITSMCSMGIHALDAMIDSQLEKSASTGDLVHLSSHSCKVYYTSPKTSLKSFGYVTNETTWWGESPDLRCEWDMTIGGNTKHMSGKFFAIH